MTRIINPNLVHLAKCQRDEKTGALLEGSSRSGKTWSSVDNLVRICSKIETNATINIIKDSYASFKTTLYDDFNRRLPMYGLQSPFADRQEVKQFNLFGNKINLLGADDPAKFHGASCDYFYVNEILDVSQAVFDQAEQRCRKFWWADYNPKAVDHWVYDKIGNRSDVGYLKTTFLDNPYLSKNEKRKLLSYEPTHPDDRELPREQRRPHPTNVFEGTADEFMWNVYGLGLRSAPEGLIFQNVTWIKDFPTNIEKVYYGSDLGYTVDPSTIVRVGVSGNNMYLEKLFHEPTPSSNEYIPAVKQYIGKNVFIVDSADGKGFIAECRRAGYKAIAANKFAGSIMFGISLMKKYKIHIVDCPEWRKEQGSYKFREIHGIKIDEPVDAFNHLWDAARYAALAYLVGK